jgi:hypothetical protein
VKKGKKEGREGRKEGGRTKRKEGRREEEKKHVSFLLLLQQNIQTKWLKQYILSSYSSAGEKFKMNFTRLKLAGCFLLEILGDNRFFFFFIF